MVEYIQTKIKYTKQLEKGTFKRVSEAILVQAVTFGECEKKAFEEMAKITKGSINISEMVKKSFVGIIKNDEALDPEYYTVKIKESVLDPESSKEKKVTNTYLVFEDNVMAAHKTLSDLLDPQLVNYKITALDESVIAQIFD